MPPLGEERVYLRPLDDPWAPALYSLGARRRAAQLQHFLRPLERAGRSGLGVEAGVRLLVASADDWRRLGGPPYGLPFTRATRPAPSLVVPADHPPRVVHRFDGLLLRAAQAGVRAPGDVREALDLMAGWSWGHTLARRGGVRTFVPWIDELVAGYLFAAAVRAAGDRALAQRVAAWDALRRAGAADARLPLAAFAGGSSRTHWPRVWWVQGTVAEPAARLAEEHGWGFARALAERLPEAGGDAEAVAALLTDLDPGVEAWHARVMQDDRPEPARPAPSGTR